MRVPIREFKTHISQYLRSVAAGESVIITVHNKPIARLEPLAGVVEGDALARLREAKGVSWQGGKPKGAQVDLQGAGSLAADMVNEDRR